jgi:hypothetical protein
VNFCLAGLIAVQRRAVFAIPGFLARLPLQIVFLSGIDARLFYTARAKPRYHPRAFFFDRPFHAATTDVGA